MAMCALNGVKGMKLNMRDDLKQPRAYALMKVSKQMSGGDFYIVSPCYVIKEIKNAFKNDGTSESYFEVVFPRKKLGLFSKNEEIVPEITPSNPMKCTNSMFDNFITCDYKDAIKKRNRENFSILSYEQFDLVDYYQEQINKLEAEEIVKIKKLIKAYNTTYEPELCKVTIGTYKNGMVFIK